ncbi:MAG: hypothetical protein U0V04_17225 [Spirosomataceae bacterium]|jgi:hypothetical protein
MQNYSSTDIQKIFNFYRTSLFSISNDIQFWKAFLEKAIEKYNEANDCEYRKIFESIFNVYDLSFDSSNGFLKTYNQTFEISSNDLQDYRKKFFNWIMNLSILKAYNASELLLLGSIQLAFFPTLESPFKNRKHADNIHREVRNSLTKPDTTNNKHLIQFLRTKSSKFDTFSDQLVRIDLKSNWINFFEMLSILRNVIAHHGTIVNVDTLNQIKSNAKDIFERHFDLFDDENDFAVLHPREGDSFLNFIDLINDFSLNTSKFIFDESDLSFLDMS